MRVFLLFILTIIPLTCMATIYKQTDSNGNVTYSDKPLQKNAVLIQNLNGNIAPSSSGTSTTSTLTSTDTVITEPERKPYTTFTIHSPSDQETIQNQPIINVKINIDPELQEGDTIQVYLDGNPWGKAVPQTNISFTAPDRGTHTIYAEILDKNFHSIKKTSPNTIYVHQAHIGAQGNSGAAVFDLPDRS